MMSIGTMKVKEDDRDACGGYAPGHYMCNCLECHCLFWGDKRSTMCADCAYGANEKPKPVEHAMVVKDGYTVPLIGVPQSSVLEECDCCHDKIGMSKAIFTGDQILCERCAKL